MDGQKAFINGREAAAGRLVIDAAAALNIKIPTLCKHPQGRSMGSCGICAVENKADGKLLPACSTILAPGMDLKTESPAAIAARRKALTALVESGQHNCFVMNAPVSWTSNQLRIMSDPWHDSLCPSWGRCELQNLVVKYGVDAFGPNPEERLSPFDERHPMFVRDYSRGDLQNPMVKYGAAAIGPEPEERRSPLDDSHPMFVRDYSRCIRCGRCIQACNEIQVNQAIPIPENWRGGPDESRYPLVDYDQCVHCGECVQACPVGALFEKKAFNLSSGADIDYIRTTCPYCGVGCQQLLHVKEGRIVRVTGVEGAEPNQGRLCVKGRFGYDFIYSEERLKTPLIRENGELRPASWDEALDLVADRLKTAIAESGPDSVAGVSCARSINEDSYQMQKLFRAAIGTNNIDHCART
jgi:predicted molibdopterin-dependent oxidoreductase YjgC